MLCDGTGERELSIDERIQRERPCRTLFVRNVKYETNSQEVREKFERMGEIKTFFDLISTRGMVFITYYDVRAATMAKERLQGTDLSGRPIDVHYSLPKDNELEKRCDRDKNQATLFLAISGATRVIDDDELHAKFSIYGEIKSIKQFKESPYQRFVEFYDSRASERAHDDLVGTNYLGGKLDLKFSWDTGMVPKTRLPRDLRGGDYSDYGQGYGQNGSNGFNGYGGNQMPNGYRGGRNSFDNGHEYPGYPSTSSFGQEYNDTLRMQGPTGSNAISAPAQSHSAPFGQSNQDPYQPALSIPPSTNNAVLGSGMPLLNNSLGESSDNRLNQAQKVQDLLASLTKAGGLAPGPSLAAPSLAQSNSKQASAPVPPSTAQYPYGLALPTAAVPNSYTGTYPSYSSGSGNEYQSISNTLTAHGPQVQPPLSSAISGAPASMYAPVLDQTHLSNPSLVAAGSSTSAPGISPAILALFTQATATNPSNTPTAELTGTSYVPSAGVSTPAAAAIPTGPRAMQAYAGPSNAGTQRPGQLSASTGISNGAAPGDMTSPASEIPKGPAALRTQTVGGATHSNGQPAAPVGSSSQTAVQQLLALLVRVHEIYELWWFII
ncbi:hypothetical protein CROQUDRAFT_205473 [Cronartium quercuum f. sp. fusiforme G11]|uniref:RRM domain-containing protein n=1 Tax=Cronartium quercuum f. sp. fusiforme G11 TaxID=708437 RepID=A0A9P6NAJ6_9BASI|nr:hypothetical protein CROQUDRAFT_205473 [Cronartium quercuum f. sp. fusiforme G11]